MSISTEQRVCGFLNTYLLDHVWNEPFKEARTNARLKLLTKQAVVGSFRARYDLIRLPTVTDAYIVYSAPVEEFASFDLKVDTWTKLSTFNNTGNLSLQVYDEQGVWLWREGIYIRYGAVKNSYLIAIDRKMLLKCLGSSSRFSSLYITKYFDSDGVQDLSMRYFRLLRTEDRVAAHASSKLATMIFINGRAVSSFTPEDLNVGDYIETIHDGNVIGKITINLQDPTSNITYNSTADETTKTIIHIPKSMNPENHVVTWNTCDIFFFPKSGIRSRLNGLFLHKCNRKTLFTQLTHNDLAIDSSIYTTMREYLDDTELDMTVLIRTHNKNNTIVRDINYIDLLYTHDDATILKFFLGTGPVHFEFWSADHLETSVYGKAMYDIPDTPESENLGYYIDTLGYNNTLALVCERTFRIPITRTQPAYFAVQVPMLFLNAPLYAIVYKNGLKVNDDQIDFVQTSNVACYITIKNTDGTVMELTKGNEIVIELFENPVDYEIVINDLNVASQVVPLSSDQVTVWEKGLAGYQQDINGNAISTYGVVNIPNPGTINETDTGYELILNPSLFQKDLIIQNSVGILKVVDTTFDITENGYDQLTSGILKQNLVKDVNVFGTVSYLVYLNNYLLSEGLDYSVIKHMNGVNECFTEIVLQNVQYLQETGNHFEVYVVKGDTRGYAKGFVSGEEVTAPGEAPFWFDNLSMLLVDGKAISKLDSMFGQLFVRSTGHRNGSPYLMRTIVPAGAILILDKYRTDTDTERLIRLRDYFVSNKPVTPGLDIIPYSHRIFSLFTNAIVRDYVNGTLTGIVYHPNPDIFMEQFSAYNWLKFHDVVYNTQDLDYIDLYPMYHRTSTDNPEDYRILQFLFQVALPHDLVKYRGMIYE